MSTAPNTPNGQAPFTPANPIVSETAAVENYVARELSQSRKTLTWTRIISLVLLISALTETLVIAGGLNSTLQPREAAYVADGVIAQRVSDSSDDIKLTIEEKTPQLIAQIPDQAIQQLPALRQTLENNFDSSLSNYATTSSAQLDQQLSNYLDANKSEVSACLAATQDPAAIHALAVGMAQAFIVSFKDTPISGGESAQNKLDKSLAELMDVKQKLDILAANKNLTSEQKNTRHAIALMAQSIGKQTAPLSSSPTTVDVQTSSSAF